MLTLFDTAILEHFKDIPVKKITVPYCQKVINKWNKQYSDMKAIRIYESNVLNYAVNLKTIADNPFKYTKAPRKKKRNKTRL